MNKTFNFFFIQILFIIYFIHIDFYKVCAGVLRTEEDNLNKVFEELYSMYKDAFENEKTYITRRLFTQNDRSHYTLHVQKLKEVNGVKTHNLRVEGRTKPDSPVIYINNPVEAGMPNPFLSIEEFKNAMRERVEKQKKAFNVKSKIILNAHKKFEALNHKDNISNEIFDVKKYVELITKNSTDKPMTTALRKINNKLNRKRKQKFVLRSTTAPRKGNKKRAQKVHVSRATKSSHLKNTTTLPKPINVETVADEEVTRELSGHEELPTKLTRNEEITTESPTVIKKSPFDEVVTTKSPARGVVSLKSPGDEVMTTKSPADEEVIIKAPAEEIITTKLPVDKVVSSKESASDEVVTTKLPADELITTKSTVEEEVTTKSPAKEEVTTKSPVDEVKGSAESTRDEVVTTKLPADELITSKSTVEDEVTTKLPAKEEVTTISPVDGVEGSAESTRDDVVTTTFPADEVVTTVLPVDQLVPTEAITEVEIVTEPATTTTIRTTTKSINRKTRTKQYRPYVFVGGPDPGENKKID